jgi:hypothetical protein
MSTTSVTLRCPKCRYEWLGGMIDSETWWGKGLTPKHIAKTPYCPRCQHAPPMEIAETKTDGEIQPSLF